MPLTLCNAAEDWPLFLEICNRCLTFAPYTVPFTKRHVEEIFAPFAASQETLCLIGRDDSGKEGVVHISVPKDDKEFAVLHLLLADTNGVAHELLRQAESWAIELGVPLIRSHHLKLNPYHCLMHGTESYCWGGLYTARNAFARQGWDLEFDIVNMYLDMPSCPVAFDPADPGTRLIEVDQTEDALSVNGKFRVMRGETALASSGYTFHKEISAQLGKGIGQLWIYSQNEIHGQGFGRQVMLEAHRKLYDLGARRIILATNNALFRAIKFYQNLGYEHELIHAYTFMKEL